MWLGWLLVSVGLGSSVRFLCSGGSGLVSVSIIVLGFGVVWFMGGVVVRMLVVCVDC